jgi:DNA-binding response OmpR family regulator
MWASQALRCRAKLSNNVTYADAVYPSTTGTIREFRGEPSRRRAPKRRQQSTAQEQPFSVLTVLLESAGEVVTREELRKRLWAEDTLHLL